MVADDDDDDDDDDDGRYGLFYDLMIRYAFSHFFAFDFLHLTFPYICKVSR